MNQYNICMRTFIYLYNTHTHIYIYIYIYMVISYLHPTSAGRAESLRKESLNRFFLNCFLSSSVCRSSSLDTSPVVGLQVLVSVLLNKRPSPCVGKSR